MLLSACENDSSLFLRRVAWVHAIGDAVASIRKVATQSAIRATVLGWAVVLLRFMLHLRHLAEQAAITYLRGVDAWSLTWDCTIQLVLLEFSIL